MFRNTFAAHNLRSLALVLSLAIAHASMATAHELPEKDMDALRALAEAGDPDAQFELGFRYNTGAGIEADAAKGAEWYRKAAEQGNPKAQYRLGFYVQYQEANPEEAVPWYKKAAEQGHVKAQMKLADCYANGNGIEKDSSLAMRWSYKAVAQGYPTSFEANRLGCGQPMITSISLEKSWEAKMANSGEPEEQMALSTQYSIVGNNTQSLAWMLIAHDSGTRVNMQSYERVIASMTDQEIAEAEQYAARFVPLTTK